MPTPKENQNVDELVLRALANPDYRWRTAAGVAKEAELDLSEVDAFLRTSTDKILSTTDNKGQTYFASKEHYQKTASSLSRFLSGASRSVK